VEIEESSVIGKEGVLEEGVVKFPAPPRPVWRYSGRGWEELSVLARSMVEGVF